MNVMTTPQNYILKFLYSLEICTVCGISVLSLSTKLRLSLYHRALKIRLQSELKGIYYLHRLMTKYRDRSKVTSKNSFAVHKLTKNYMLIFFITTMRKLISMTKKHKENVIIYLFTF